MNLGRLAGRVRAVNVIRHVGHEPAAAAATSGCITHVHSVPASSPAATITLARSPFAKRAVDRRDYGVATQNLRRGKQGEPLRFRRRLAGLGRALDLNSPLANAGNHAIVSAWRAIPTPTQDPANSAMTTTRRKDGEAILTDRYTQIRLGRRRACRATPSSLRRCATSIPPRRVLILGSTICLAAVLRAINANAEFWWDDIVTV